MNASSHAEQGDGDVLLVNIATLVAESRCLFFGIIWLISMWLFQKMYVYFSDQK